MNPFGLSHPIVSGWLILLLFFSICSLSRITSCAHWEYGNEFTLRIVRFLIYTQYQKNKLLIIVTYVSFLQAIFCGAHTRKCVFFFNWISSYIPKCNLVEIQQMGSMWIMLFSYLCKTIFVVWHFVLRLMAHQMFCACVWSCNWERHEKKEEKKHADTWIFILNFKFRYFTIRIKETIGIENPIPAIIWFECSIWSRDWLCRSMHFFMFSYIYFVSLVFDVFQTAESVYNRKQF